MKKKLLFREIDGSSFGFFALLGVLALVTLVGLIAAIYMEHNGHYVTGMNNQIVWGMPHVFAVFLIVAASGALNVASISSVFGKKLYKPLAPLSAILAVSLLAGGLVVVLLDLGRPDRLIVAMTTFNFKSIFAWNILLYTGFFAVVLVYLWTMLEARYNKFSPFSGFFAFLWRLTLTTGTGSIFGFLVAREAYNTAVMAPMFVIMSFSFGLAFYILVLMAAFKWTNRELGDVVIARLRNLLAVFIGAVLYFVVVYHLTNLYITQTHGIEKFILVDGGIYTSLFWWGQIVIGSLLPMFLIFCRKTRDNRTLIGLASVLVILGGLAQMYVIIIGGQAFPLQMFPGKEVSSSFFDGMVNSYSPTLAETLLGIGGIGLAMLIVTVATRALRILPESLSNKAADPHYTSESA